MNAVQSRARRAASPDSRDRSAAHGGRLAGLRWSEGTNSRIAVKVASAIAAALVAVILYNSGLSLNLAKLQGHARRVVTRLIIWGLPVTWGFAALLLGMSSAAP